VIDWIIISKSLCSIRTIKRQLLPSLIRHGLDWPLNASSPLSASAELLVELSIEELHDNRF